ncbi:hypothetical protein SEA_SPARKLEGODDESS_215 [Streptomyces phage SparkleGoddess]|uniref:Uncharacterized protein n=1 Tax=Streptomyces phage SparkleGoddess TaxID=2283305 RepID=A0A345MEB3_9CAUD|nr:hypothetical protein SEA_SPARKLEGODDESS_215 [Streptomyces phage SparkleGoddess]QZE11777.1 hypothetical protein SEA_KARP_211 [Streptomyces phage Karp]UTN92438.1 hypothetical protein SEA_STIGMA_214 [Streptomyces phage Stigma]
MKVSTRVSRNGGISIKKLGRDNQSHKAGTVVMRNVRFNGSILGDLIEESKNRYVPRVKSSVGFSADGDLVVTQGISDWGQARYIKSLGGYYNIKNGQRVESAAYVYIVGSKIYYTN